MQQLAANWRTLDPRRKIVAALAGVAVLSVVLMLAAGLNRPAMTLLYAGLDGAGAGEILSALDQRGVAYEVRGDAIYVPATQRDGLRMSLAGEGLPANDGAGYELLDTLSGFGTTAEMFDAAYWRAKEGELARTIAANPSIRSARVHISNQEVRGFRAAAAPKASVTVSTAGGGLSAAQAKAFKYLVASAVAGLSPADVSVIDSVAGLVPAGDEASPTAAEGDRAEAFRRGVERLLEARVGYGNAVVEVSLETVNESEAITERRFDPDGRVAISTDSEERSATSDDSKGGAVTVASNLPEGDAGAAAGSSRSQNTETRERVNFEVSETTREVVRTPGSVKRLTVAVLIDGIEDVGEDGTPSWSPRPAEELAQLRDLVASAVGFDESRGDVITIESLPFEPAAEAGTEVAGGFSALAAFDAMSLIQLATLAVVAIVLGLFVLRPILTRPPVPALAPPPAAIGPVLTGEIDDGGIVPQMSVVGDFGGGYGDGGAGLPAPARDPERDAVERLRRLIAERKPDAAGVLRAWVEEPAGGAA